MTDPQHSIRPLPRLLWLCSGEDHGRDARSSLLRRYFEVVIADGIGTAVRDIRMLEPRLLCFDFEAPQTEELQAIERVKRDFPSLPILMLTETHSEELAIWALRTRIWNFLVKPVSDAELQSSLQELARIVVSARTTRVAHRPAASGVPKLLPVGNRRPGLRKLMPALRLIESRYAEKLRAADLARACGMASFQFSRAFHAECGVTFREYLVRFRISQSCQRLLAAGAVVTRIGVEVGFSDASHFSRAFRRLTGLTPSAYHREFSHQPSAARPLAEPTTAAADAVLAATAAHRVRDSAVLGTIVNARPAEARAPRRTLQQARDDAVSDAGLIVTVDRVGT